MRKFVLVAAVAALLVPMTLAQGVQRVSTSEKGSLIVFPKVELRFDGTTGALVQDTFIDLTNDYPDDVKVLLFFVSETCVQIENDVDLTGNQPSWWSSYSGLPGPDGAPVTPFTSLGAPYPDPEGSTDMVLRGFVIGFAINNAWEAIRWNHLFGQATLVNYVTGDAWEYEGYTFAAVVGNNGDVINTTGELHIGTDYAWAFDKLLLDFFATGSHAFGEGLAPADVIHDTDLALLILNMDLRQDTEGPFKTKAKFYIWNENETSIGNPEFCLTKWAESRLTQFGGTLFNLFNVGSLHTDKGYAWIDGQESTVCPQSEAHALLGVQAKKLTFLTGPAAGRTTSAGGPLPGFGTQATDIVYDLRPGGDEKKLNPKTPAVIRR